MNLVDKIKKDIELLAKQRGYSFESDFDAVGEFHRKFGLPVAGDGRAPRELTPAEVDFRFKFLAEELLEIAEGLGITCEIKWAPNKNAVQDVPKAFDGLLDLVYVALGTAHMGAWPWAEGFAEVQRANMSKERAKPDGSNSTRGSSLDVVKPEGFKPPNIIEVLMKAGWKGPQLLAFDLSALLAVSSGGAGEAQPAPAEVMANIVLRDGKVCYEKPSPAPRAEPPPFVALPWTCCPACHHRFDLQPSDGTGCIAPRPSVVPIDETRAEPPVGEVEREPANNRSGGPA